MKSKKIFKLLALVLVFFAFSCAKDDFEATIGLCPEISSTIPANNEVSVPLNQAISATFNKLINTETITSTSFTVNGDTPITGTISFASTSTQTTATFTPTVNFNVKYYLHR